MATDTTDTGQLPAGTPDVDDGRTLADIPADELFPEDAPAATPEPADEPAVVTDETPEAVVDAEPAKVEETPATEAAPETEPDTSAFNAEAYATANGIDPDLIRGCATPDEALRRVTDRLHYQQDLAGRQANELGALRKQREAEAAKAAEPEPEPETGPDYAAFLKWHASDPEKANQWYQERFEADPVGTTRWVQRGETEPLRQQANRLEQELKEAKEAPRQMALQQEFVTFKGAHATDFEAAVASVKAAAADLGVDPRNDDRYPLEDLRALGALKANAAQYRDALGLISQGMPVGLAAEHVVLKANQAKFNAGAEERTSDTVATARAAAAPVARGKRVTIPDDDLDLSDALDRAADEGLL